MPSISVDGIQCTFEGKTSLLQAALDGGVEIPHYCYHPGLPVVASCRICLAEVSQPNPRNDNKLELIPKLVPTCQTPAVDGAVVHLRSPKSVANQKSVMEMLLINHPLDCPVCDQAGECSLQDYSYRYGNSQSRFVEAKLKQPKKDVGPNILLYSDRCIMCSRCVRFTREVSGTHELGIFGRGSSEQIDVFPGRALDNELAGNVVDICPVGALLDKDFLMTMRVWNLTRTASIDGITASGDNLSVETNEGKVYRFKPRTNMDVNRWWTSDEIRYGWKFVHSEERFAKPMRRTHGVLEACDWEQAYRTTRKRLGEGDGDLLAIISPMLPSEEAYLLGRLALKLAPAAKLAIGPVPVDGEDKSFPGGYTVVAEKAPNARGVRRALERLVDADDVLDAAAAEDLLGSGSVGRVLLTGNYPSAWATPRLRSVLQKSEAFTVLIDTLPSGLTERDEVDVLLPGCTWLEKEGSFENHRHRMQSFEAALAPREGARPEGRIALELLGLLDGEKAARYDAQKVRAEMGGAFLDEVHGPEGDAVLTSDVEYVAL
ncbi:molybdopterin-dependent oxidoreductase [Phycisphaera mikurensis]|uniref:Putative NADH-quinone oxidoreductase subunit G n=1 Tax=Phycisphaera mikurensis (strain NBRC 102666 / KCTC 22515 / FYK2301M01) TaxID=1142394 RepID=I0IGW8_PHYMF|nr:molybdopterin-dependent oxidoreductase [Phycisphaera mikurensis]MBB6440763.1 NADH-quinone oxidoreductase subunit G [Phycisphaera mikurensis]BAM04506.1 putative NADH-quinone oxidoreductase subunit G [Phycisphaera mikurensis NBRC 102666]